LTYYPDLFYFFFIRIDSVDVARTLNHLKKTWNKFAPGIPFDYRFLDEEFENLYNTEHRMGKIFTHFSLLALFIATLGLFGLTAYITEQRTKEIGIRKILGATIPSIVGLLTKEFTKWILTANFFAWPIAFFVMKKWLESFPYRTNIALWFYLAAGSLALAVALITVCYQSIKAATGDPVKSLRYE
jgi:putative ABC transport system permease protein